MILKINYKLIIEIMIEKLLLAINNGMNPW